MQGGAFKMSRNYYESGGWNLICDSCAIKYKASKAKQRWDGYGS